MVLYLLAAPFVIFTIYRLVTWIQNYSIARSFGLPIVLIPVAFDDVWWMPIRPFFAWVERLPLGLGSWYVYTEMGWPTVDESRTVKKLGENFVLCSPSGNQIISCYMPTINKIFMDHRNWAMPTAQSQLFAVYGQNVSSTHGAEWQRHRKITASAFNEQTMAEVWRESKDRVRETDLGGTLSVQGIRDTVNLMAMRVLANVAFGKETELTNVGQGHRDSLMGCLGTILNSIILTLVFSNVPAPDWMLPNLLRKLKAAVKEFKLYMEEYILREMQTTKSTSTKKTLLASMVQANEAEKNEMTKAGGRPSFLTESELYGNIFVFNLAGYETTASTFTFALSYLALHPKAQDWLLEEIESKYDHSGSYAETFSKLPRCLAIMYETLRLAGPAPLLVRQPAVPTELEVLGKDGPTTITVPPGTYVGSHFYGGHLSPKWGDDVNEFKPQRFVGKSASGEEVLSVPEDRMYLPWIMGPRVCPGKKFSQVEFVGIVAQLLEDYRIEVDQKPGETPAQAQDRLRGVLSEKYFNVSAYVKRPEAAGVRLVRRSRSKSA